MIEGYKLDSNGKSTTKYRIIQFVKQYTKSSMTEQEKIDALYDWVLNNDMEYFRTYEHVKADWVWKDCWVDDMAASLMDKWGGNCYRFNAFMGMLIREATGLQVTVYHGNTPNGDPHGWATVCQDGEWYVYDVELQKFAGYSEAACRKILYSKSTLHRNGVGTNLF